MAVFTPETGQQNSPTSDHNHLERHLRLQPETHTACLNGRGQKELKYKMPAYIGVGSKARGIADKVRIKGSILAREHRLHTKRRHGSML
jgi:hypothetical protein